MRFYKISKSEKSCNLKWDNRGIMAYFLELCNNLLDYVLGVS